MRVQLTNTLVDRFKGGDRYQSGKSKGELIEQPVLWDAQTRSFGVRLSMKTGVKAYILQVRPKGSGVQRTITIGRHGDPFQLENGSWAVWDVAQARARAAVLKAQFAAGTDTVAENRARVEAEKAAVVQAAVQAEDDRKKAITLREALDSYLLNKRTKHGPLRNATKVSMKETIERYLPDWLDEPMEATITQDSCHTRFAQLSDSAPNRKTGQAGRKGAANMTMVYLRALVNHARAITRYSDGRPRIFIGYNPVTLMTEIRKFNPEKKRKGRIPRDRIGHVYNALREAATSARTDAERTAADWITTILMTGMRLTESASLLWSQVDLEKRTVRLLGDVVKNHNELTIPLSQPLHELLVARRERDDRSVAALRRRRERAPEYVFPSFGKKRPHITDARATQAMVDRVAGCHVSIHDLRRTYEDVLRFAKVDPDVRRILTNHVGGDVHQASYANNDSDDALRPDVEAAASWILDQARIAAAGNILQFPIKEKQA